MKSKRVVIVYTENDASISDKIMVAFENGEYELTLCCVKTKSDLECFYQGWTDQMPNMIITINLAGFSWRNTGGNSMYSMLPIDMIHYINRDIIDEKELLSGLIPVTMRFLVDNDERKGRIEKTYRRIHQVVCISEFDELVPMLAEMRWRRG